MKISNFAGRMKNVLWTEKICAFTKIRKKHTKNHGRAGEKKNIHFLQYHIVWFKIRPFWEIYLHAGRQYQHPNKLYELFQATLDFEGTPAPKKRIIALKFLENNFIMQIKRGEFLFCRRTSQVFLTFASEMLIKKCPKMLELDLPRNNLIWLFNCRNVSHESTLR